MVGRRGLLRLLLIGAVVAGIGAAIGSRPAFTASTAVTLPACTAAQLTPSVGASVVDQGVGSYADTATGGLLARGKDTVVRFFLVTPTGVGVSCSGSIAVRSATLTVTSPATNATYSTVALQTFGTTGAAIP